MKTGLCLSGGANKGSWEEGVVEGLQEVHGISFDRIAGTSIGGVVGAMLAAGMTIERRRWWWSNLTWGKVTNMKFPPVIAGLMSDSFFSDAKMRKLFKSELPPTFADLKTELFVAACDLMAPMSEQANLIIGQGDLIDALCATVAIPGIFPPLRKDGRVLVDGGIGNYIPLDCFFDGFDRIFVLIAGYGIPPEEPKNSFDVLFRSIDVFQQQEIIREVGRNGNASSPKLIVIWNRHPEILNSTMFDWLHGREWLQMGYEDAAKLKL